MSASQSLITYWQPRYWLTWFGLLIMRIICLLPWKAQVTCGKTLGLALYYLLKRRRSITQTNLQLCFPELTQPEQAQLTKKIFCENALGLLETGLSFWAPNKALTDIVNFEGFSMLQQAQTRGKGVILVGAHYTTLDLGGRLFSQFFTLDILYRPHNNALFNAILLKSRQRWASNVIANAKTRQIVRSLQAGHIFWFPADQDYGPKHSTFVPFFGINAATVTTTAKLAILTKAPIFILGHHRINTDFRYQISVKPVFETIPDNPDLIARKVNTAIETEIRKYPEQYMWVHRRFKTRPTGEPSPYSTIK